MYVYKGGNNEVVRPITVRASNNSIGYLSNCSHEIGSENVYEKEN